MQIGRFAGGAANHRVKFRGRPSLGAVATFWSVARSKSEEGSMPSTRTARSRPRRAHLAKAGYPRQFAAFTIILTLAAAIQWAVRGPLAGSEFGQIALGIAVLVVVVGAAVRWWRALYLYLAGATGSAVVLTLIAAFTAVGTVVVQKAGAAEFAGRWGSLAGPMRFLGFNDVFASYPFVLLLALLAVMSTVTVVRRRKTMLRWRHFGLLLTHISIVVLLIGGGIGAATGTKGMIHLEVGDSRAAYQPRALADAPKPDPIALDFSVRLDGFKLDEYKPEYKVYTYRAKRGGSFDVVAADKPQVGELVGAPGPGSDVKITVTRLLQRAVREDAYAEAPAGQPGSPVMQLKLLSGGTEMGTAWLTQQKPAIQGPQQHFTLRMVTTPPTPSDIEELSKTAVANASRPGASPAADHWLVLLVASTSERLTVVDGRVTQRSRQHWGSAFAPLERNPDRLAIVAYKPILRAIPTGGWTERKTGPLNPAVELRIERAGKATKRLLLASESEEIRLAHDRVLVFSEKPNKVRNYESTVSILKDGRVVNTQLVKVNHPLRWDGYDFYQSNFDPKNPRYSGLQVVHDPGLPLVNLAFWLLMYGVLHTVMLRRWTPWWERKGKRTTGREANDDNTAHEMGVPA